MLKLILLLAWSREPPYTYDDREPPYTYDDCINDNPGIDEDECPLPE